MKNKTGQTAGWLKAWRVSFLGSTYITQDFESAMLELKDMDVGSMATIFRIRITQKEYDAMPEFEGF